MVLHCSYKLVAKDIILPIYDVSPYLRLDVAPLHRPSRARILLTFPRGLRQYLVFDRVAAPYEELQDSRLTPDSRKFQWDDPLLNLVSVYDNEMHFAYGAIEFKGLVMDASGTNEQRVAVLFVSRLDETEIPTNWTCIDIGRKGHHIAEPSLRKRAMKQLSLITGPSAYANTYAWEQECLLELPSASGDPGHVTMDDLGRDLSAREFGGYGKTAAAAHRLVASATDRGYYLPILAQIVLPPQDPSNHLFFMSP